jgi:hypothetical protein
MGVIYILIDTVPKVSEARFIFCYLCEGTDFFRRFAKMCF